MVRVPTNRPPRHPGDALLREFLVPLDISLQDFADAIYVPWQQVNEIVNKRQGITPGFALRLSRYFGTTEFFWTNLQLRWDLYWAMKSDADVLGQIQMHPVMAQRKEEFLREMEESADSRNAPAMPGDGDES